MSLDFEKRINGIRARQPDRFKISETSIGNFLPIFPADACGFPNYFIRSGFFGVGNLVDERGKRKILNGKEICCQNGFSILYDGPALDQVDKDTILSILKAGEKEVVGKQILVTTSCLLKIQGKTHAQKTGEKLEQCIKRLRQGTFQIKCLRKNKLYIGGFLKSAFRNKEGVWVIEVDENIVNLFADDMFSFIDLQVRSRLNGRPLSKWLHAFYCTHKNPYPMKLETLLFLAGCENKNKGSAFQQLNRALNNLAICWPEFNYKIENGLVFVGVGSSYPRIKSIVPSHKSIVPAHQKHRTAASKTSSRRICQQAKNSINNNELGFI